MGGLRVSCVAPANGRRQTAGEWGPLNPPRHVPRPECPGKRAGEGGICVQVLAPSTRAFPATFGGARSRREGAAPSILTEETACQLETTMRCGGQRATTTNTESDTRSGKKAHDLPPEVVNIQTEDSQIGQGHEERPTVENPPSTTARSPLLAGLADDAGHQSVLPSAYEVQFAGMYSIPSHPIPSKPTDGRLTDAPSDEYSYR